MIEPGLPTASAGVTIGPVLAFSYIAAHPAAGLPA